MKKRGIIAAAVIVVLIFAADLFFSNFVLSIKKYEVTGAAAGLRIALVTDMHLGTGHIPAERIVKKLKAQAPDIIALAGDFVDDYSAAEDFLQLYATVRELAGIAPVYFSLGNHERDLINAGHADITEQLEAAGAVVLDCSYTDIDINGVPLRIGGILDEVCHFYYTEQSFSESPHFDFLEDYNNTERYKIMLCHRPDSYYNYERLCGWDCDLLLCGHTHGGVIRVPFWRAVWTPDMGWFPELSYGFYKKNQVNIVVSSGLAGYKNIPRLNNLPEICIIDIAEDEND